MSEAEKPKDPPPEPQVTSWFQSGGITAGTVNVNQAPDPTITSSVLSRDEGQGPYLTTYIVEIDSAYPLSALTVLVTAPSLAELRVRNYTAIAQTQGGVFRRPDGREGLFSVLSNPVAPVRAFVYTSEKRDEIEFNAVPGIQPGLL
jgi:hypothetical protein